jgi:hypothetical protein
LRARCFFYQDRLRIVAGRFEALHRRRNKGDPPAPLPEHRAAKIAAVHGKRAKLYEKRQQVLNLGPDALALLTEITHREPRLASRRVEELYELLEGHGDDMLREAIGRTVRAATLTVAGVKRALSKMGARRRDGSSHRVVAAQPRSHNGQQLTLAVVRADAKRGAP